MQVQDTQIESLHGRLEAILSRVRAGACSGIRELELLLLDDGDCCADQVLGHLALAYANADRFTDSIACYKRLLGIHPDWIECRWRIADRLVNLGQIQDALEEYRKVLEDEPDCIDAGMGIRYCRYLAESGKQVASIARYTAPAPSDFQVRNSDLNQDEFSRGRIRLKSLPTLAQVESTEKCNFYCRTCSKGYEPYYAEDLHGDVLEKVRAEVLPGLTRLGITGFGEPTMSENFDEILAAGLANGSRVHFVTNGSLLNFERLERICRFPVFVTFSADGSTKETFESVRTGSNFERFVEKLAMIKKLRDVHLSAFAADFDFNFVGLRKNIHELPGVLRLAARYGIYHVRLTDYSFGNTSFDEQSLRFDPITANRWIRESQELAKELGVELKVPPPYPETTASYLPNTHFWRKLRRMRRLFSESDRFPAKCRSPWSEPWIHSDGKVSPCCAAQYIIMGDLKQQRFSQLWNGVKYRMLRRRINSGFPPVYCRDCFVHWGINGGNPAHVRAREGALVKAAYFLEIKFMQMFSLIRSSMPQRGETEAQSPKVPNFYMGRPIRKVEQQSSGA